MAAVSGMPGLRSVLRDNRRWWIVLALLFGAWAWWSPEWSINPGGARNAAIQLAATMLFGLVVLCASPSPKRLALALVVGGAFQAVIVIGQLMAQSSLGLRFLGEFVIRPNQRGLSLLFAGTDELMRPYGLTVHPNVVGGYLTISLLALTGWLSAPPRRWLFRLLYFALAGLIFWALLGTFSRGAWLGLLFASAILILLWLRRGVAPIRPRWSYLIPVYVLLVLVGIGFLLRYSEYVWARAGTGAEVTELRSLNDRRIFAEAALQFVGKYPVTGVGIGNYVYQLVGWLRQSPYYGLRSQHVHNLPLLITAELGLTGGLLWAGLLSLGAGIAWRNCRDPFAIGVGVGAAALFAIGLFDHYPWTIMHFAMLFWACLGVAMRTPTLVDAQLASAAAMPEDGQ
ncbi:MAG: O-antigen ligase family protein [Anaerolineae bacterium]